MSKKDKSEKKIDKKVNKANKSAAKNKEKQMKQELKEAKHIKKQEEKEVVRIAKDNIKAERAHRLARRKEKEGSKLKWDKLDNTANLFPVIANESVSNVYRISATLYEEIDRLKLQEALDIVLPKFDIFNVRLKKGIFWYYFETNMKEAPLVTREEDYPCKYIEPYSNNNYMFRVTYYNKRINLEVFHVLSDGLGAVTFLKELIYQYLRLAHSELSDMVIDNLSSETSLNKEDSYIKNYKKPEPKGYKQDKAFIIKNEMFRAPEFGVMHGLIDIASLKRVTKEKGISINQFLVGTLFWSIYKEYLHEQPNKSPICSCVPVNLRPYFDSNTTKNFFAVVTATFEVVKDHYTYDEVLELVASDLKRQINKEHLEKLFSYNVASEKSVLIRAVPLFIKNFAMKQIYKKSARANTSTLTNIGPISLTAPYEPYVDKFHVILSMSKGQNLKGSVCSFKDKLVFTFSSAVKDTSIQRAFFRKLTEQGIGVAIESNGVYYE